jgi:serine/threonine protein kinase
MAQMWNWCRQLISAIYTCHNHAKVVHRDIKPSNLMLNGHLDSEVCLIDFGASERFREEDDTFKNIKVGTLHYFAPEMVEGNTVVHGCCTDIWAMGLTLYEVASGALCYQEAT